MNLDDLNKQFRNNLISKADYIEKMFDLHSSLFDYANFISNTDITKIEISHRNVILTLRADEDNIQLICPPGDKRATPIDILNFGRYESLESKVILSLLTEESVVLDIGANIGFYSILMARKAKGGWIYSFEPIPATFRTLQANIELNRLTNVQSLNFGFSNEDKEVVFYFTPHLTVAASLSNIVPDASVKEVKSHVRKMDNWSKTISRSVDFIKCDVEGAELLVYQGGLETIRNQLPIIFSEMLRKWSKKFRYHPNDIINLLSPLGYSCYGIGSDALTPLKKINEDTIETNYIFLHSTKHTREKAILGQEGLL